MQISLVIVIISVKIPLSSLLLRYTKGNIECKLKTPVLTEIGMLMPEI